MADAVPSDPWFQSLFADRLGGANYGKGTEIYKFEKIKRAKRKALADHPDRKLLDFGIGENDDMAAPVVRESLKREADKVENRGYADNGVQNYKDAAAEFMSAAADALHDGPRVALGSAERRPGDSGFDVVARARLALSPAVPSLR